MLAKFCLKLLVPIILSLVLALSGRRPLAETQATKGGQSFSSSSSSFEAKGSAGHQASKFRATINQIQQRLSGSQQVSQQPQAIEQVSLFKQQVEEQQVSQQAADAEPTVYGSVKGTPGVDFPAYSSIPNTKFSCQAVPYDPGMYADESTGCQVYHLCFQGRRESFLCGIGTVFNQAILACDFWHSVDCLRSSSYYSLNSDFGKSSSEPAAGGLLSSTKRTSSSTSFRQSLGPVQVPVQLQQQVSQSFQRTSDIVQVPRSQVARVESVRFVSTSATGGKVSPRKQTFANSFSNFRSASGSTEQSALSGSSLLSPGRRVALMSGQPSDEQAQFASASSMLTITANQSTGTKSAGGHFAAERFSAPVKGQSNENSTRAPIAAIEAQPKASNGDEWRPYFKSKSPKVVSGGNITGPIHPTAWPSASTAPVEQPPTVAPPNQEPNFSSGGSEQAEFGLSDERPTAPKSGPPPTVSGEEATAATTGGNSLESNGVGPALGSTTAGPEVSSSAGSGTVDTKEPPSEPTTAPDAITTTTTTTSTTTTTTTEAPQTTTTEASIAAPEVAKEAAASGAEIDEPEVATGGASEATKRRKRKKKRRSRTNAASSSSVEYAKVDGS